MKKFFLKTAWLRLIEGILLVILGLLIAIIGGLNTSDLTKALSIIIAVFLFLDGALSLFTAIFDTKKVLSQNIFVGSLLVAIGVLLCLPEGESIPLLLPVLVSSVLLCIGGASIFKGIADIYYKTDWVGPTVNFLIAVATITLGVLALVFKSNTTSQIIYIILGSAITVAGTLEIILAANAIKHAKSASSKKVVEGAATIVEESKALVKRK